MNVWDYLSDVENPPQKMTLRRWVAALSIFPILLISDFYYVCDLLNAADDCTGTESANFARTAFCHRADDLLLFDCLGMSFVIVYIWIAVGGLKRANIFRVILLVYVLITRILLVPFLLGHNYDVVPFTPGA
jgi:hypothetical protein